jgi:hypothetical protein
MAGFYAGGKDARLAALIAQAWWVDAVTSLAIVGFVVKEAREAWSGEDCCEHD